MSSAFWQWVSVVSVIINIVLIIISVGLAVDAWHERKRRNSQVKIWMEQANGVNQALIRIVQDKWHNLYSSVSDIPNVINAVQASTLSLWTSLYEERVLSEKEYKEYAMKIRAKLDKKFGLDGQEESAVKTPEATEGASVTGEVVQTSDSATSASRLK